MAMTTIRIQRGAEVTVAKAREILMQLPDTLAKSHEALPLTRRGEPVMAWDLFETIQETLKILSDEELMGALHRSILQA